MVVATIQHQYVDTFYEKLKTHLLAVGISDHFD